MRDHAYLSREGWVKAVLVVVYCGMEGKRGRRPRRGWHANKGEGEKTEDHDGVSKLLKNGGKISEAKGQRNRFPLKKWRFCGSTSRDEVGTQSMQGCPLAVLINSVWNCVKSAQLMRAYKIMFFHKLFHNTLMSTYSIYTFQHYSLCSKIQFI